MKRIILFGSETIVGCALMNYLSSNGDFKLLPFTTFDLNHWESVLNEIEQFQADIVFNTCLKNYGISKHIATPADLFEDVRSVEGKLLPAAFKLGIKKYVNLISNCVYPGNISVPFLEENLWDGSPDDSVMAYAQAKRSLMIQADAFRKQYGFNVINLILTAVYGPHDSFDRNNAQVIPSMIVKLDTMLKENKDEIVLWGSGNATREFIFIEDAAKMIWSAACMYNSPEPLNISTGDEVTISKLADTLKEVIGFAGTIQWDASKPEGIRRKCLSPKRFQEKIGTFPLTPLKEGLEKTLSWYQKNILMDALC